MEKLGNHYLGADFSIASMLLLTTIFIFIFYFRKKIFPFLYKQETLEPFLEDVKSYLQTTYPKFNFDYNFIETLNEQNPDAKKYEILDNIILQYINFPYKPNITSSLNEKLWDSYVFYSKPDGTKKPKDWMQRKNAVIEREKQICQRCSKKITLLKSDLIFVKPIESGGSYYLENLVIICNDCSKIEKNKLDNKTDLKNLEIKENLYTFIK
ncbi:MAG TPA: hypothetical protein ENK66_01585 [Arcobacter sp.]|jgi:5-methylcytosine-specific restriction endonuclease McrA|nr:hypothetical protein [Arcobacter sp.]